MWSRFAVGGALATISVVVALLIAEGVLRLSGVVVRETIFTVDSSEFDTVPGIFSPNQKGVQRKSKRLVGYVTINNFGYRGLDFPLVKRPNEFRIFMTGDSFVFGDYVNDEQTLPVQLEKELKKVCGPVLVINGGLGGSTISDQIELTKRALVLNPDLVIIVFSENDFDDLRNDMWRELANNRLLKSNFPFSIVYRIVRKSALWTLTLRARQRLNRIEMTEKSPSNTDWKRSNEGQQTASSAIYRSLLAHEKTILKKAAIPLFFSAYPGWETVFGNGSAEEVNSAVEGARAIGVPSMDLIPTLRASGLSEKTAYLLPDDGHPSAKGYQVVAKALCKELMKLDALTNRCKTVEVH